MLKEFWSQVTSIMINISNSYHQTRHKNLLKFAYVYLIGNYRKCVWLYDKIGFRFKFYTLNYYRFTIWLCIFHVVKCMNKHQNNLLTLSENKKIKNSNFFRNASVFYCFFIMFLHLLLCVFENNWNVVLTHLTHLNVW